MHTAVQHVSQRPARDLHLDARAPLRVRPKKLQTSIDASPAPRTQKTRVHTHTRTRVARSPGALSRKCQLPPRASIVAAKWSSSSSLSLRLAPEQ